MKLTLLIIIHERASLSHAYNVCGHRILVIVRVKCNQYSDGKNCAFYFTEVLSICSLKLSVQKTVSQCPLHISKMDEPKSEPPLLSQSEHSRLDSSDPIRANLLDD